MTSESLHTYLRDHLAGAAFGSDLARHLDLEGIAADIEKDRETLLEVMDAVGAGRNPVKEAVGWLEKAGRVKFTSLTHDDELGTFMALEALFLGITGKRGLWIALRELADERLAAFDLERLVARADQQRDSVEALRLRHVAVALTT